MGCQRPFFISNLFLHVDFMEILPLPDYDHVRVRNPAILSVGMQQTGQWLILTLFWS
jgi:hypothetical protein